MGGTKPPSDGVLGAEPGMKITSFNQFRNYKSYVFRDFWRPWFHSRARWSQPVARALSCMRSGKVSRTNLALNGALRAVLRLCSQHWSAYSVMWRLLKLNASTANRLFARFAYVVYRREANALINCVYAHEHEYRFSVFSCFPWKESTTVPNKIS